MDFVRALTNARNSVLKHISRRQSESSSRLSMQNTAGLNQCLHERRDSGDVGWICGTASGSSTLVSSSKEKTMLETKRRSGCPTGAPWMLTMARSRSSSLIIFRISSTKEASYQEPQVDKSFKLFYLVHSFADGPCRILFYEMGMRRWAVEPRHMEPSEKADTDRRPAQGIWLAASLFKTFARQETLRHALKNLEHLGKYWFRVLYRVKKIIRY